MTETEWLACEDFVELFRDLDSAAVLTQRKLRLFEVAYRRRFTSLHPEPILVKALNVAELFADGMVTEIELAAAHEAARELEDESEMPGEGSETDALYYGAKAVREATSPNHADYCCGTGDVLEHLITALAYASPSAPEDGHKDQAAFFGQVSDSEKKFVAELAYDIFGNPFRPIAFPPMWRTTTVVLLARQMYESRDFSPMPILADALQDAGCDNAEVLAHCREPGPHVRGCFVVDLLLGKE